LAEQSLPYIPDLEPEPGLGNIVRRLMDEPYHEYWYHLGRFIHAFARAESQLLLLAAKLSGLTRAKAGVIFHGLRAETARELINNILKASNNNDRIARLERPFFQMAAIGTVRNNIVHWGRLPTTQEHLQYQIKTGTAQNQRVRSIYCSL
jgi:hypothetical protein